METGLEGLDPTVDEWARNNQELLEEHREEIEILAQLVSAAQLEGVAKRLVEQGGCSEEDVMRMAMEAKLAKKIVGEMKKEREKKSKLEELFG